MSNQNQNQTSVTDTNRAQKFNIGPRAPFRRWKWLQDLEPTSGERPRFTVAIKGLALASCLIGATACDPDTIADEGLDGEIDGGLLSPPTGARIDVHTHLASQPLTDLLTGGGIPAAGAEDLVARLDEANVDRAVILGAGFFALPDDSNMAPENDYVASQVAEYPERLIGFCGINPVYESAPEEVDRCLATPGMIGVKLHMDGSQVDLENDDQALAVFKVFDRIEAHDAPVMMHVSDVYGGPLSGKGFANLSAILEEHPSVRVAHAHCAGNVDDDSIDLWLRMGDSGYRENAFVDISACLAYYKDAPLATRELMVWRLRTWGIERVLFGSDYFQYGEDETPLETLSTLAAYPFTQEELDTIVENDASAWLGEESP